MELLKRGKIIFFGETMAALLGRAKHLGSGTGPALGLHGTSPG